MNRLPSSAKTKIELATGHLGACSQATKGPKNKLAVLTGDCINEGLFYKKMYGRFAERPKKVAVITRWA